MARVYIETSFVSACVTTRSDAASVYRRDTSVEWMRTQASLHELVSSTEVLYELSDERYPRRDAAIDFLRSVELLSIDDDTKGLASLPVNELVMPGPVRGDALHVAAATVHRAAYLLSWNVRHLANPNKVQHLQRVCMRAGVVPPSIVTPDFLWENR